MAISKNLILLGLLLALILVISSSVSAIDPQEDSHVNGWSHRKGGYRGRCKGTHCPKWGGGKTSELDTNDATFGEDETKVNEVEVDAVKPRPQQHKQQHLLCPKPPLCN